MAPNELNPPSTGLPPTVLRIRRLTASAPPARRNRPSLAWRTVVEGVVAAGILGGLGTLLVMQWNAQPEPTPAIETLPAPAAMSAPGTELAAVPKIAITADPDSARQGEPTVSGDSDEGPVFGLDGAASKESEPSRSVDAAPAQPAGKAPRSGPAPPPTQRAQRVAVPAPRVRIVRVSPVPERLTARQRAALLNRR